jgi:mediator of RNA polymerase II transcription subunit 6
MRTTKGPAVGTTIEASEFQDLWTLEEALRLLARYGDEYMDEHPLVGEPGSFILSKSSDASSSRQIPKTNPPRSTQLAQIKAPRSADAPSSDGKLSTPIQPPDGREKLKRRKSKTDSVT